MAALGPHALDETMTIEHGMGGVPGGSPDIARQAADQQLADLACAPVGRVPLEGDDRGFELRRELAGIAYPPPRAVAPPFKSLVLVTLEDLIPGLMGYAELAFHAIATFPMQLHGEGVTHMSGTKRYLCVGSIIQKPKVRSQIV